MVIDNEYKIAEIINYDNFYEETTDYGFNDFMDANRIGDAYYKAQKSNNWKKMTQEFRVNCSKSVRNIQLSLITGTYEQEPFYEFNINERGKIRHIRAQVIKDRVVQRDICDNVIEPSIIKLLIYDNGASVKNKGITFSRERVNQHLVDYVKHHGVNGWVLQIDFKKFFDSIPHKELIEKLYDVIDDEESMNIIIKLISQFSNDEFDQR